MGALAGLAIGTGTAVLNNALQIGQQQSLQNMQIAGQKEMGQFNQRMALDMWDKTNYSAQMAQMEKAGLNAGLMYGNSGGGGATTNVPTGNVSGAQANPDVSKGMAMGLQAEAIASQIEVNKAQTQKLNAETTEVQSRTPTYQKGMEKTDAEIKEIATKMNLNEEQVRTLLQGQAESKSKEAVNVATLPQIKAQTTNIQAQTGRIEAITPIEIAKIKEEVKGEITRNSYLDRMQKAELDNLIQDVQNKRNQITQTMNETEIKAFTEEMKADYPSLFDVGGRVIDGVIRGISRILSGQDDNLKRKIEVKRE